MRQVKINFSIAHSFFSLSNPGPNWQTKIQRDHRSQGSPLVTALRWSSWLFHPWHPLPHEKEREKIIGAVSELSFRKKLDLSLCFVSVHFKRQADQNHRKSNHFLTLLLGDLTSFYSGVNIPNVKHSGGSECSFQINLRIQMNCFNKNL